MNLKEFINFRRNCPSCNTPLVTSFHSKRKQKHRYEENRIVVLFDLKSLKKGQAHFKAGYSFGLEDNSFYVDFYTQDEELIEDQTHFFLMERFKDLDNNLGAYTFYRSCDNKTCNRYFYASSSFNTDYKSCSIGDLDIFTEFVVLIQPTPDGYKICRMTNHPTGNETWLNYGRFSIEEWADPNISSASLADQKFVNYLKTSLIPFVGYEETLKRVNKLLIFA